MTNRDISEEALRRAGSPFALVNMVAKRSRQLNNGVPPLVSNANPGKSAMTALAEIAAGKVTKRRKASVVQHPAADRVESPEVRERISDWADEVQRMQRSA